MPIGNRIQEQFMVLVHPDTMLRMDTLRIAMSVSRGQVNRTALDNYLPELESIHADGITTLTGVAASVGLERDELVRGLVKHNTRNVPNLEELRALSGRALLKLYRGAGK